MAYTFKHGDRPLDDYAIQRAVGSGGFGEVYYAVSDGGREVALKYLKENPHVELRGVGHCINLKSPHLVSIFDVKKSADGDYFIIMEYCSGPSLRDLLIAEPNGFGTQKATFFAREIAKGLAYLHDRGIVHRDLKPGNLFYDDGYVKIGDYGLSKFISVSRHSAQTASIGTVHYMAPEIGSGNYSRGVDIYALGVILYEMLLGKVPFEGSSMAEVLMKHLTTQPELDELPHPFGDVIRKALEKDPADRYKSVDEMIEQLLEVEAIKQSLDGFSVKSLEGAVYRGAAPSPAPSPNPAPPAQLRVPPGPPPVPHVSKIRHDVELPKSVARRLDRVARRIDQKVAKLNVGRPRRTKPTPASTKRARRAEPVDAPAPAGSRAQAVVMTVTLSIAIGFVIGNALDNENAGFATAMMTVGMMLGLSWARRVVKSLGVPYGKDRLSRVIHAGCCAPFLGIGATPLFDSSYYSKAGVAVWVGLMLVALFADWRRHFERRLSGPVRFGNALWVGFGAVVTTAIACAPVDIDPDEFVLISAAVAGVVTLIAQSTGVSVATLAGVPSSGSGSAAAVPSPSGAGAHSQPDMALSGAPYAAPTDQAGTRPTVTSGAEPDTTLERWTFTRAVWGILTFLFVGTTILTILVAALADLPYEERTYTILSSIMGGTAILFTIRKTTPTKNLGFWREWLRPFLITVSLFGIGGTTTAIARYWSWADDITRALMITGLVMSALMFGLFVALRGKRRLRKPTPFLTTGAAVMRTQQGNEQNNES